VHARTFARARDAIVTRSSILLADDPEPFARRTKRRGACIRLRAMTTPVRTLPLAALAAFALIPATVDTATTIGSSFDTSRGAPATIACNGCTIAMSTVDWYPVMTDPGIVTSFRAELAAGTTAKLRVFRRDDGSTLTPIGTSAAITGTGSRESYTVHLPVPNNATIGLDLNGSIAAIAGTAETLKAPGVVADGSALSGTQIDDEPLLSATFENDYDNDGLADDSEDACVFCPQDNGGGTTTTDPGTPPAPPSDAPSDGGSQTPSGGRDPLSIRSRTVFTIQDSGLVTLGSHPVARAYLFNPHTDSVSGTATLTVAGRKVAKRSVFVISQDAVDFKISAKVAKAIRRGAKAVVSATVDGGERDATPVTFAHPVTTAFDGTYRGAGPLVIKVRSGVVEVASRSLFISSTRGSGSMTRQFSLPDGIPAIVGRNGTVKVHGDSASDEVRFEATFRRNGTVKGYLSLWYTQLGLSGEGKLRADQYLGASNWTAKRVGR
jgi:hypothetical protein